MGNNFVVKGRLVWRSSSRQPRLGLPHPNSSYRSGITTTANLNSLVNRINTRCYHPHLQRSRWAQGLQMPLPIPHHSSCSPPPSKPPLLSKHQRLGGTHPLTAHPRLLTSSPQIVSADSLSKSITSQLSTCPSDTYVIVTQPGVHAEDYSDGFSMPYMRRKIQGKDDRIRSSMSVSDVLGTMDTDAIVQTLESKCGVALMKVDASSSSFHLPQDRHAN